MFTEIRDFSLSIRIFRNSVMLTWLLNICSFHLLHGSLSVLIYPTASDFNSVPCSLSSQRSDISKCKSDHITCLLKTYMVLYCLWVKPTCLVWTHGPSQMPSMTRLADASHWALPLAAHGPATWDPFGALNCTLRPLFVLFLPPVTYTLL